MRENRNCKHYKVVGGEKLVRLMQLMYEDCSEYTALVFPPVSLGCVSSPALSRVVFQEGKGDANLQCTRGSDSAYTDIGYMRQLS